MLVVPPAWGSAWTDAGADCCEADWLWTVGVLDVPNSDAADDGTAFWEEEDTAAPDWADDAEPSADAMPNAADASAGTSFAIFCTEEATAPFGVDPATPKADAISDGTASCEDIAEPEVAAAADSEDVPSICWADGSAAPAEDWDAGPLSAATQSSDATSDGTEPCPEAVDGIVVDAPDCVRAVRPEDDGSDCPENAAAASCGTDCPSAEVSGMADSSDDCPVDPA